MYGMVVFCVTFEVDRQHTCDLSFNVFRRHQQLASFSCDSPSRDDVRLPHDVVANLLRECPTLECTKLHLHPR